MDSSLLQPWTFEPEAVAERIVAGLADMFEPLGVDGSRFSVRFEPPPTSCAESFRLRASAVGRATIRWSNAGDAVSFPVPWCHHGVFLLRSDRTWRVERWRWQPRLTWVPGLHVLSHLVRDGYRALIVADRAHSAEYEVRASSKTRRRGPRGGEQRRNHPRRGAAGRRRPVYSPPRLRLALATLGLSDELRAPTIDWDALAAAVSRWCDKTSVEENQVRDSRDVAEQRLFAYNVYLQEALLGHFARAVWTLEARRTPGEGRRRRESPERLWRAVVESSAGRNPVSVQRLVAAGLLVRFDPSNGIDAIAGLTELQRYDYAPRALDAMPAWGRQNHSSFHGLICPVETPETKRVGITLHTASGCRVTVDGHLPRDEMSGGVSGLGHAATLVPFAQHNDGVRCMMGAKNLKQAVVVRAAQAPGVATGTEETLADLLAPLREVDALSAGQTTLDLGVDLLVAYLPWYGWNADDAIVGNERLRDRLCWEYVEEQEELTRPGVSLNEQPGDERFERGLRKAGPVGPRETIARLCDENGGHTYEVPAGGDAEACLEEVTFDAPRAPGFAGRLWWRVRRRLPLDLGDKLMGRHGNKGVVSTLRPDEELPRLPDDDRLPLALRGRAVDLVLNPNGVVSRMNLGQLIETHCGLLTRLRADSKAANLGVPFGFDRKQQEWLAQSFQTLERETGGLVDRYGRVKLDIPDTASGGAMRRVEAIAGFQYFVRLKHVPALKANARRGGAGYAYSLVTGQPVAGRGRRGGQRLGEMEIWALHGHVATHNLRDVLGPRSNPAWSAGDASSPTYYAIRDHLRAVGVALDNRDGTPTARWLAREEIEAYGREVESVTAWEPVAEGEWACPKCEEYRLDDFAGTTKPQRGTALRASILDAIRARRPEARHRDAQYSHPATPGDESRTAVTVTLPTPAGRPETIEFAVTLGKRSFTVRFELDGREFAAYRQRDLEFDATRDLLQAALTCPRHTTSFLQCPTPPVQRPVPGGVCDPELVGPADVTTVAALPPGFIHLPVRVPNPLSWARPNEGRDLPEIECLPVLPLRHRKALPGRNLRGGPPVVDPLTRTYLELLDSCAAHRLHESESRRRELEQEIQGHVASVFTYITGDKPRFSRAGRAAHRTGRLFGKQGLLRYDGLGRRVDRSGRLVIVPDPDLEPDQCRMPDHVLQELSNEASAAAATAARSALDELFPESGAAAGTASPLKVLLNRQPTLHRYNLLAFRPVAAAHGPPVLRINPMACAAFNADFDGDEMAVHVPRGEAARRELDRLSFGAPPNLLSVADGSPVVGFGQELVLGHFLLHRARYDAKIRRQFVEEVLVDGCPDCSAFAAAKEPPAGDILKHVLASHPEAAMERVQGWAKLAWRVATHAAIGFGWIEAAGLARQASSGTPGGIPGSGCPGARNGPLAPPPENRPLEEEATRLLENALNDGPTAPLYGLAALVLSGARGSATQVRQILGPRGWLSSGDGGLGEFFISSSLSTGMDWRDFFLASFNARSSMIDKKLLVAHAGALTRRLVLACWPWRIGREDCGSRAHPPAPATCGDAHGRSVCSTCYGPVAAYGGELLPTGFPIGLVAAQSIGERGTQLSMQSFHTGQRAMTPETVSQVFRGRGENATLYTPDGYGGFLQWIRDNVPAYQKLDTRHSAVVWLAIHHSPDKSLQSAWTASAGPVGLLAGSNQPAALVDLASTTAVAEEPHPVVRLLTGTTIR